MITITTTPNGIRLTRGADSYTAIGPAALASLISQLAAQPIAPAATPAQLGARLATARTKVLQCDR